MADGPAAGPPAAGTPPSGGPPRSGGPRQPGDPSGPRPRDRLPAARGLTARELAAVLAELQSLRSATVLDIAPLAVPAQCDDLLLVLQEPAAKAFVLLAPGGDRAHLCRTARRYPTAAMPRSPQRDVLQQHLVSATLTGFSQPEGERRCELRFATAHGDRRLVLELFGARGLWALLDAEGRAIALSRPVATAVRTLGLGDRYAPPPSAPGPLRDEPAERFTAPVLASVDAHFTALDAAREAVQALGLLQRAAQRSLTQAQREIEGKRQQLADSGRAAALRADADLLLAYAHQAPRGARELCVPDPETGAPRTLALDPAKPVVLQAQTLYDKARRLEAGRARTEQALAEAEARALALGPPAAALQQLQPTDANLPTALAELHRTLQALGVPGLGPAPGGMGSARPKPGKAAPDPTAEFRRFVSAEGYPLWVGRDNEQNDRLTMRIANGNDLWLHVGGQRAGAHVVVRLPKGKTASLETLLDAATLAVHFSKARGEPRIEVVYTHKKHVRKPKGLPPGAVVPAQTKTIVVRHDPARLQRVLDSAGVRDDAQDR
ncbi:MAG: DUF814 domain-containing protein [Planctomycetes bacterium]|nr:DUF814 domain-containing protein [Planctomycetota bacterium]